jgi:septal ring factor EnvC (AmiA/AmiB activator)
LPRKRKSVELQLTELEEAKAKYQAKVDNYKAKVTEIDLKIRKLKDIQKQRSLEKLFDAVKASGKTPEEIIAVLNAKKE